MQLTRSVSRLTLSAVLQLEHWTSPSAWNPSTPRMSPKKRRLLAPQSGHGPWAMNGSLKRTCSVRYCATDTIRGDPMRSVISGLRPRLAEMSSYVPPVQSSVRTEMAGR